MLNQEEAASLAELMLRVPADHPEHPWELQEFAEGWLIWRHGRECCGGGRYTVIERDTARIMRFPSWTNPTQITGNYAQTVKTATSLAPGSPAGLRTESRTATYRS